jgi:hypothetical protein
LPGLAAGLLLTCCVTAGAQDKGDWRPASSDAKAVTGDIGISEYKLFINFNSFTLAQIRALKPDEVLGAFNADSGEGGGNLYRMEIPAQKKFAHHNTLCGSEETQWMATYAHGRNLQVAFFSGAAMPVITAEALNNSPNLCGTYSYMR